MQICIFEDKHTGNFEPLSFYRPVFDLVCGISTLREKILRYYPDYQYSVLCRDYLADIMQERHPGMRVNQVTDDDTLFINGRILIDDDFQKQIRISGKEDILYTKEDTVVALKLSGAKLSGMKEFRPDYFESGNFEKIRQEQVNVEILKHSFDLIRHNHQELQKDFEYFKKISTDINDNSFKGVHIIEEDNIIIRPGVEIKPGVVLDASGGPILIGKKAVIYPNSVIEGAVYIGYSTLIKSCSTIYSNVSIGNVCKVGGELEDVIMLDYSNKQHSGFIGHAYLGSWVNLGADTNCSDLKNNYAPVRITLRGEEIDTGMQFLGLIMGDHSKTAINTMFNTGTVAGFSANIFGAGFPDKYIPSFSWGGSEGFSNYKINKSIETAKVVMDRRKISFSDAEEALFREIFKITAADRLKKDITE